MTRGIAGSKADAQNFPLATGGKYAPLRALQEGDSRRGGKGRWGWIDMPVRRKRLERGRKTCGSSSRLTNLGTGERTFVRYSSRGSLDRKKSFSFHGTGKDHSAPSEKDVAAPKSEDLEGVGDEASQDTPSHVYQTYPLPVQEAVCRRKGKGMLNVRTIRRKLPEKRTSRASVMHAERDRKSASLTTSDVSQGKDRGPRREEHRGQCLKEKGAPGKQSRQSTTGKRESRGKTSKKSNNSNHKGET